MLTNLKAALSVALILAAMAASPGSVRSIILLGSPGRAN
jgi:hypothetical protein